MNQRTGLSSYKRRLPFTFNSNRPKWNCPDPPSRCDYYNRFFLKKSLGIYYLNIYLSGASNASNEVIVCSLITTWQWLVVPFTIIPITPMPIFKIIIILAPKHRITCPCTCSSVPNVIFLQAPEFSG